MKNDKVQQNMKRYPRITAHLIAESLGYFAPRCASHGILKAKEGEAYYCEWYSHIAQSYDADKLKEVTKEVLKASIVNRHYHNGGMSNYKSALALVKHSIDKGEEPNFGLGSWF